MANTHYPPRGQRLSMAKIGGLGVIIAFLIAAGPHSGFAQTPAKTAKGAAWVFYGLWLDGDHGAPAHWDAGSPNFKIVGSGDPASPLLKEGMRIACIHAMNVRAGCLVVDAGSEGNYQWGAKAGKSLQEGEQVEIVKVSPFHSKKGDYLWVEMKGQP